MATSTSTAAATSSMLVLFAVMLGSGLTVGTVLFREVERRRFANGR